MKKTVVKGLLFGLSVVMGRTIGKDAEFRAFASQYDCIAQVRLKDGSVGRYFMFKGGKLTTRAGIHPNPDVTVSFKDAATAIKLMKVPTNQAESVHAAKNFRIAVFGDDTKAVWFTQLLNKIPSAGTRYGTRMADGGVRYTNLTNGGPLFVYVKDGKVIRTCPIDFDDKDAKGWTIEARGRKFTPKHKATVAPHALAAKSVLYSENRNLYPMKRVDFDPNGERNPQNRGVSGYERISWDEAAELVAAEIKRMKTQHGPGAMAMYPSSHQQWGNVNYWISSMLRFGNLVGFTRIHQNPDSWEGWYWGAQHHFGNSMRVGLPGFYGLVEDCLKECELMVFWSSDPETTTGGYAAFEGTQRRLWAKELGVEFVHIDPQYNATAQLLGGKWIPIRPGTDAALAHAIMQVWVAEDLYDKDYVATRTTGFDEWRDYLTGKTDGVAKTPEWQEAETGVPASTVRALARLMAKKKTYLSPGSIGTGMGGACRTATGTQWARSMIQMMAMRGWGKPGVNFGNMTVGTPVDYTTYFPGYAEGGISGELQWSANAVNNYLRMPHVLTMNPVKQMIPRQRLPEAIINGHCTGYLWDGSSNESQFAPFEYPMKGYSPVHMLYRFGASSFGTIVESGRFVEAYRHPSLEFVVNQSPWFEGEAQFADLILPACTSLERWDISEWCNCAGYIHHLQGAVNHRTVLFQHKCVEPLGESRSDYEIFATILKKLGYGAMYTEGCSELDWCKRIFDSSDIAQHVKWKDFVRKGYYVLPPEDEKLREPPYFRWFAEGRHKDVPEPLPLPSQYAEEFGKGVQTNSGKIEFIPSSIALGDPDNPDRPPLNRYMTQWEGPNTTELVAKYPLQMISLHPRYSFHTHTDGKGSAVNDIPDHRVQVGGHYYWVASINPADAASRGIRRHDLIRLFNDRGAVICAADLSSAVMAGVVKTAESSAEFDLIPDGNGVADRGGCVNLLTPSRPQVQGTDGMAANSCLIQVERWAGAPAARVASVSQ